MQIVRDAWSTFLRDQYDEMRREVREQQKEQKEVVKGSEAQLERFKSRYSKELKKILRVA